VKSEQPSRSSAPAHSAPDRFLSLFSSEKRLSDQLFWMAFYVCVGLLPPLIGIIGHKAVLLPLLIISALIITRFFMREDCRHRMISQRTSPGIRLLLAFTLLVSVQMCMGLLDDPGRLRIIGKPINIFLITVLLAFVWSHKEILKAGLLVKLSLIGAITGFLITVSKLAVMQLFLGVGYVVEPHSLITSLMHVYDTIESELKILSIFVFTSFLIISNPQKRYLATVGLLAIIVFATFHTIGFNDKTGEIINSRSETVQFGVLVALIVLALACAAPRLITHLLFSGLAIILASAPWLFQSWYELVQTTPFPYAKKFLVRGEIWDAVGRKALEAPWFGFGIDSTRYLKQIDMKNDYMPTDDLHHPHNMVLQLWLDVGLSGVLIIAGLLFFGWRFVNQIKASRRPPVLAGLSMLVLFMMVSTSIWQTWAMALITYFIVQISVLHGSNFGNDLIKN
jgi:O-antigen ligase